MADRQNVVMRVNGKEIRAQVEPRQSLGDFLRDDVGATGTHLGCEHGVCGACTVLLNGEAVRSCLMFAVQANGADVVTVEGLSPQATASGKADDLSVLQRNFSACHALQCGYCTPGFLITATELLRKNPDPTADEVREALSGNICRCTGYVTIVEAVLQTAKELNAHAR